MQGISLRLTKSERKRIKALQTSKGRIEYRQFIAEGTRLLEECLRHRFMPLNIYYAPTLINDRAAALIKKFTRFRVSVVSISSRDIAFISPTATSQGIIGLFEIPDRNCRDLLKSPKVNRILLLDMISDPGNAGNLIRSAVAYAFDLVLIRPNSVDPFNPRVVRATAGAIFAVDIAILDDLELEFLKKSGRFLILAADPKGEDMYQALNKMKDKFILTLGAEAAGLSPEILKITDLSIRVPHSSKAESLNVAAAGSIIMNELFNKNILRRKK